MGGISTSVGIETGKRDSGVSAAAVIRQCWWESQQPGGKDWECVVHELIMNCVFQAYRSSTDGGKYGLRLKIMMAVHWID
jgi:hypothetical protein